jgi:pimeloyl-ACP methyl ester carboxylesterase
VKSLGNERIVSFTCDSCRLFGMLHLPTGSTAVHDVGVVLLNQGPLDRSGSHRTSVRLARRLVALGFPVLRFDARGVGESEGEWVQPAEGEPIRMLWREVEEGAWVADTHAAIDFFLREVAIKRVILAGLCGGGLTALHSAHHERVLGVAMVGMPVRPQSETQGVSDLLDVHIESEAVGYVGKMFTLQAWRRFITLQTDYKILGAVLLARLRRLVGLKPASSGVSDSVNASFQRAIASGRRLIFIYAEGDYFWIEFQHLFMAQFPQANYGFSVTSVPQANHTFTERAGQEQLEQILTNWSTLLLDSEARA